MDKTKKIQLKKLQWRSRRGLLELDLQLTRFCETVLPQLSQEDCRAYEALLALSDNDLLDALSGRAVSSPFAAILKRIAAVQPGLYRRTYTQ